MERVAAVAYIEDGKILLVDNRGNLALPGGRVDPDETDVECLQREISKEEFKNTRLSNLEHYKNFEGISPRRGEPVEVFVYRGTMSGDLATSELDDDVRGTFWASDSSDKRAPLLTREIIDSLIRDGYM